MVNYVFVARERGKEEGEGWKDQKEIDGERRGSFGVFLPTKRVAWNIIVGRTKTPSSEVESFN